MKTKFNNSELCHIWASQSQTSGKGSSLSFEGKKLLSYNWYCIGMFINSDTVLIRKNTYSNSTAKHFNHMHRAIGTHINKITVETLPDYSLTIMSGVHTKNINSFVTDINNFLPSFEKARTNKQYLYNDYLRNIESLQSYCTLFNISIPQYIIANESYILSEIEKVEQKRREKEEKETAFYNFLKENSVSELNKLKERWLNGETNETSLKHSGKQNYYFPIEETLLRVKDNSVQTSKGATVPVKEAEILYHMIKTGKDIKGFRIGNYTVIGINGTLKIGCHEISKTEIERFAALMNW